MEFSDGDMDRAVGGGICFLMGLRILGSGRLYGSKAKGGSIPEQTLLWRLTAHQPYKQKIQLPMQPAQVLVTRQPEVNVSGV